ncbi:MAG: hypothetical protein ACE5KX_02160 [Acidimicrobiia bacterium]
MLVEGAGRFALGPLWEVAASTHTWGELTEHVPPGPARAFAAHERVIRGEDLSGDPAIDPLVLELPLALEGWEPAYPLATYRSDKAEFPSPDLPRLDPLEMPPRGQPHRDHPSVEALLDLTRTWTDQSNGRAAAAAVEGDAAAAVGALGQRRVLWSEADHGTAMAAMAWAGASGGAYGRRRGTPAGRLGAWWAVASMTGLLDDWPVEPERLGEAAEELRWHVWEPEGNTVGWGLYLAAEDPEGGLAWAVAASDSRRDEDALAEQ